MSQPMAPSSMRFFTCISGPDQGKRFEIREGEVLIGRSLECKVLSDDHDGDHKMLGYEVSDSGAGARAT